jgi:hypothetical protein
MNPKTALFIACCLACAGAWAQTPAASPDLAAAVQLTPQTENGVTYLCGGVGKTEADQMKRDAADYNLMLTFAENTGEFLADVNIDIADTHGNTLLNITCDAPILLVNLDKAGTYRVTADVNENAVSRLVHVRSRHAHNAVALVWPRRTIETEAGTQG